MKEEESRMVSRMGRRRFARDMGLMAGGTLLSLYGVIDTINLAFRVSSELNSHSKPFPEVKVENANQKIADFHSKTDQFLSEHRLDELSASVDQEKVREALKIAGENKRSSEEKQALRERLDNETGIANLKINRGKIALISIFAGEVVAILGFGRFKSIINKKHLGQ